MMTDASGVAKALHDYLPFSEEIPAGSAAYSNRGALYGLADAPKQKVTGKERDAETGLDSFGAK